MSSTESPIHTILDINGKMLSICASQSECAPDAHYWFPTQNIVKLEAYCKINGIEKVSKEHFTKLLAGGIVKVLSVTPRKI